MKVVGLELISVMVAEREFENKIKREARKKRINALVKQGISKEVATAMVDAYTSCGIYDDTPDIIGTWTEE